MHLNHQMLTRAYRLYMVYLFAGRLSLDYVAMVNMRTF